MPSFPRRRALWLLILAGLVLAWFLFDLRALLFPRPERIEWRTATVLRSDIEDTVLATGTIRASKMINVGTQATGQVKALHVKVGDQVRQGQPIAEIDATTQQNTLRDDMAALESLKSQRVSRQAALKHARLSLDRQRTMYAREATSRAEFESAQNQLALAEAELKANEMQLQQAANKIETSRANLGYTRIVAPMDGTVVAVVTEQGQTVNAMMSTPTIVKLARLDVVQIEAQISEADVTRVRPGMPAWFTLLGDSENRHPTELESIDLVPPDQARGTDAASTGSASTGTQQGAIYYNGVLQARNDDGQLRVSMTAQVHIVVAQAKGALVVPSSALGPKDADGRREVRVLVDEGDSQRVDTRKVRIGLDNRVQVQVLEGLSEGEIVIVGKAGAKDAPGDASSSGDAADEANDEANEGIDGKADAKAEGQAKDNAPPARDAPR